MREKRTYRKQFVLSKSTARKLKVVSQMLGTSQNEIIDRAIVSYADQLFKKYPDEARMAQQAIELATNILKHSFGVGHHDKKA